MSPKSIDQLLDQHPEFAKGYAQRDRIVKLGAAIRKLRTDHLGITQEEAAKLIGVTQSELSRIETGAGQLGPSMTTVGKILDAYSAHYRAHHEHGEMELTLGVRLTEDDVTTTTVGLIESSS